MKLFTRRQIIKIWQGQKEEWLDLYCCPNCKHTLYDFPILGGNKLECRNWNCNFTTIIAKKDIEKADE